VTARTIALLAIILILGTAIYFLFIKKTQVPVQVTKMVSPQESIWNRANLKIIPSDKRYRVYPYRLRFPDHVRPNYIKWTIWVGFDVAAYRKAHPDDVVLIEYDEYLARVIEVYAVSDTLDGRFFDKSGDGGLIAYE